MKFTTPIITEEMFKMYSPAKESTDTKTFIPYIITAQKVYVEPVIGEMLLAELVQQVTDNNLTDYNGDLIVEIAPFLSFSTVYQALPFVWISILNKGVTLRSSENSQSVTAKDIGQIRQWLNDEINVLQNNLIDFLKRCKDHYPLWNPNECSCDTNSGSTQASYNFGIYFPKS